ITFVNKLDREGSDPFDLLDEIEQSLALDVTPAPGRSAWGATFSAPTTSSPMRSCCSSAASTTGSPSRSAAVASTTRNCCGYCRKLPSPNCAGGRNGEGPLPAIRGTSLSRGPSDARYFGSALN